MKNRIIDFCDRVIEIFVYVLLFSLPFAKALIEVSATIMIFAWVTKKAVAGLPFSGRRGFIDKLKRFTPARTYLNIPVTVFILASALSVVFSSDFSLSLKSFFSKTMEYIFLLFIVAEFACDKRKLKNTVIVMLSSAAMIGADCIFQYLFGFDILRFRTLQAGRMTASFSMPGDLAGYLGPVLCLPLSLSFLRLKRGIKYFLRAESIFLLGLLLVLLARGAWLGFMIAVCFLGIMENRKIFYVTVALMVVLTVLMPHLIGARGDIFGRLKSIVLLSDSSSLDRKTIWHIAVQMVRERPLFGQGLSTFMGNFVRFGRDYSYLESGIIPYAHNCYLQMAAETGIVGLLSFLMVIGAFFACTIKKLAVMKDRFTHAVLSGISAGIIVTLVHSLVDTNLYSLQLSVLFWVMLGINAAIIGVAGKNEEDTGNTHGQDRRCFVECSGNPGA